MEENTLRTNAPTKVNAYGPKLCMEKINEEHITPFLPFEITYMVDLLYLSSK